MAVFSANTYYEYTTAKEGAFNGGVYTGTTQVPHPIAGSPTSSGDTIVDYMSVTIGGFNGLNN